MTDQLTTPSNNPFRGELRANILCALQKLTPRERTVFELSHFHSLRLRATGEILNTSQASTKNTSFRATHKLRIHLAARTQRKLSVPNDRLPTEDLAWRQSAT